MPTKCKTRTELNFLQKIFKKKIESNSRGINKKVYSIQELLEIISKTKDSDKHKDACKEIGILLRESKDQAVTQELINLLNKKLTKDKRDNILYAIGFCFKGPNIDVSPIFEIIKKYKQWSILDNAISALKDYSNKSIDDIMNYLLKNSDDEYILTTVNATVNKYGNRSNIPFLKLNIDRKGKGTADTIASAMLAIVSIGDVREQDFFIEYLNKGRLKSEALEGLCLHGDEKAILPIINWTKSRVKNKPKRLCGTLFFNQKLPIQIALEFLDKYKENNNDVQLLFDKIGIDSSKEYEKFV